jgi:hypothetical protein
MDYTRLTPPAQTHAHSVAGTARCTSSPSGLELRREHHDKRVERGDLAHRARDISTGGDVSSFQERRNRRLPNSIPRVLDIDDYRRRRPLFLAYHVDLKGRDLPERTRSSAIR